MGILTDPSLTQRNLWGRRLLKHNRKIVSLLYLAGCIWFCCLGYKDYNHSTYLSENALSPGLVYSEIKTESARLAQTLLAELNRERQSYKSTIPYAWITAKMQQIGLEVYTQNFTLNYPLGSGKVFTGKNVYGILRAPRIGSTEGIVFSTPYRPPDSIHTEITASVPTLLAFAEFARKKNYWAKDLIFLITDKEQLGMYAWLEAYYKGGMDDNSILQSGNLKGRSGALQAALNLEVQDFDAEYVDVKLEGLNGQLPNLDMFNLVQRITARDLIIRENIPCGYKQTQKKRGKGRLRGTKNNIKSMLSMILSQASGVPTGNHGLFHRYRVEALTLEVVQRHSTDHQAKNLGALAILKVIEGISRSLNNLLERFHQSYFFYILVSNDRFVSIGDFMPCLIVMTAAMYIKAFFLWLSIDAEDDGESPKIEMQYTQVGIVFMIAHVLGLAAYHLPTNKFLNETFAASGMSTESYISLSLLFVGFLSLGAPYFVKLNSSGIELLHVITLLELATFLVVIGLLNFSLGFLIGLVITPLTIVLDTNHSKLLKGLTGIYTYLLHPLNLVYLIVFVLTLGAFPELTLLEVAKRAITATMDALTYSVVDSMIYGNWLFNAAAIGLFPSWILLWRISWNKRVEEVEKSKKKLKTN